MTAEQYVALVRRLNTPIEWPAEWWGNRQRRVPPFRYVSADSGGLPVPMRSVRPLDFTALSELTALETGFEPHVTEILQREDAGVCLACGGQGWRYISEAGTTINCFDCDGEGWDDTPEGTLPSPQRRRGTGRIDGYRGPHEDYDPGDGSWLMDINIGTWRRWSVRPAPEWVHTSEHDAHLDDRSLQAGDELARRHSTEHNAIGAPGNPDAVLPTGRMTVWSRRRRANGRFGYGHVTIHGEKVPSELPRAYLLDEPMIRVEFGGEFDDGREGIQRMLADRIVPSNTVG